MDRINASVLGGVLLIVAMQLRPSPPTSTSTISPPSPSAPISRPSTPPGEPNIKVGAGDGLPRNEDGPWAAICRYFAVQESEEPDPGVEKVPYSVHVEQNVEKEKTTDKYKIGEHVKGKIRSCVKTYEHRSGKAVEIKTLIATVPDPVNSQLALEYDRSLASIERAAAYAGYSFDRYWVPWEEIYRAPQVDLDKLNAIDEKRHRREEQPGVFVFRNAPQFSQKEGMEEQANEEISKEKLLFVFLVGETPTFGINKVAFSRSVDYSEELRISVSGPPLSARCDHQGAKESDLLIAGPHFSGSLHSLSVALDSRSRSMTSQRCVRIVSASTSDPGAIHAFKAERANACASGTGYCARFHLFIRDGKEHQQEILNFLKSTYGYNQKQVAFLRESASAYGGSPKLADSKQSAAAYDGTNKPESATVKEGSANESESAESISLTFPRGIAPLRNAYQAAREAENKSGDARRPLIGLPLSFRQIETREQENVPVMARDQTPVSQDNVLRQISETLSHRRIKVVAIFATDALDNLFLLQSIRRSNPDVRLVITIPDLMFLHAGNEFDSNGTLVFSHFPLFTSERIYESAANEKPLPFAETKLPSSLAESTFLTTLSLLRPVAFERLEDAVKGNKGEFIASPPLWVGVFGSRAYWPVRELKPAQNTESFRVIDNPSGQPRLVIAAYRPDAPTKAWGVLAFFTFLFGLLHFFAVSITSLRRRQQNAGLNADHMATRASVGLKQVISARWRKALRRWRKTLRRWQDSQWLEYFVVDAASPVVEAAAPKTKDEGQHREFIQQRAALVVDEASSDIEAVAHKEKIEIQDREDREFIHDRAAYLFAATLVVLLVQSALLFPALRMWPYLGCFIQVCLIVCASIFALNVVLAAKISRHFRNTERSFIAFTSIVLGTFVLVEASLLRHIAPPQLLWSSMQSWFDIPATASLAFAQRSLFPFNGISPVLPILLSGAGLYLWAIANTRRLTYAENRRPEMPTMGFRKSFAVGMKRTRARIDDTVTRTIVLPAWVTVAIFLMIVATFLPIRPRTVEGSLFDLAFTLLILALWTLVVLAWLRFLITWRELRQLLRKLERIPLRYAFNRIPETFSWSPIWQQGGMKRSFLVQTRSVEYLRYILPCAPTVAGTNVQTGFAVRRITVKEVVDALTNVLKQEAKHRRIRRSETLKVSNAFEKADKQCVFDLSEWLLRGGADVSEKRLKQRKDLPQLREEKLDLVDVLKAEFLALRFVAYIRYVSLHMRNQLFFISMGFILALLAIKSYPFQQTRSISWAIIAFFSVLTLGIIHVFADMDRDAILSRISNTDSGKLDRQFFWQVSKFVALPLFTILASQFPAISGFLFSWVRPGLETLK